MSFRASLVSLGIAAALATAPPLAHADPLADALRRVMAEGLAAYDREDLDGTLKHIHTKSPEYDKSKVRMEEQFAKQNVTVRLTDFRYIGHDDEFAFARVHIKLLGNNDPSFADNVVDNLTMFKMENGQWKWWGDYIIGVEFLK